MSEGRLRHWLYTREVFTAIRLSAFGEWWAAHAARRLKALAKKNSQG